MRLMQFPVALEAGADVVEGPYVAETFNVSIEDEYIVLEMP
jgi:3-phenylpropionate/trans-cinnamate dioxygenase ferredoxin subunit